MNGSHVLMTDDNGRFVWVPHFEVNDRMRQGWVAFSENN